MKGGLGHWMLLAALSTLLVPMSSRALSIGEIATMPRDQITANTTCCVTGVVTIAYSWIEKSGVVADVNDPNGRAVYFSGYVPGTTRGVFVNCDHLETGDVIELKGNVLAFIVDPGIDAKVMTKIGHMNLPEAPLYTFWQVNRREHYNRRARMEGTVRRIRKRRSCGKDFLLLDLSNDHGSIPVSVSDLSRDWERFLDEDVVVDGVLLPVITIGGEALYPELAVVGDDPIKMVEPGKRILRYTVKWLKIVGLAALVPLVFVLLGLLYQKRQARMRALAIAADRKRIAGELHDSVAQYLSGTKILLTSARKSGEGMSDELKETIAAACDMLDRTRQEVRSAINDLRSDDLLMKPLAGLLKSFAQRVETLGTFKVTTSIGALPSKLTPEEKSDVLSIIQEAASNAIRHGGATEISLVARSLQGGGFEIVLDNNGAAFDVANVQGMESGHYGLSNMKERAARSGLNLTISGLPPRPSIRIVK